MAGCAECGGCLGANPKSQIFAAGLTGTYSQHTLCQPCWQAARSLGGPGPNVSAAAYGQDDAARAARRARRGY